MTQSRKMLLEFAPLLVFLVTNWSAGIYWATGLFMVATVISLTVMYMMTGKIAQVPLISAVLVIFFGGLTIYLQDSTFIKVKVTFVNTLFAVLLVGGLTIGRLFLKDVMGDAVRLSDAAWRTLTWRWVVFFLAVALLNEYVWRSYSEQAWINFKVFGLMGLTFVFAIANTPFMLKNMIETNDKPSANG
jgi:intracellular septation protein